MYIDLPEDIDGKLEERAHLTGHSKESLVVAAIENFLADRNAIPGKVDVEIPLDEISSSDPVKPETVNEMFSEWRTTGRIA